LLPWSGTQLVVPLAVAVIGPIDAFLALLAQAAGRWKTAARHYQCAIDSCIATDNRAVLAQTQYQYADGLLSHGQPGAASDVLDSAERIAAELNLSGLAEWITRLRREHKLGAGL
jgi:hypothetical protein